MSELWQNPLFSLEERLEVAEGAIAFRDKIIANLRGQIEARKSAIRDMQSVELGIDQIADIWNGMPGGHEGFLKEWGYLTFARALEEAFRAAQTKQTEPQ